MSDPWGSRPDGDREPEQEHEQRPGPPAGQPAPGGEPSGGWGQQPAGGWGQPPPGGAPAYPPPAYPPAPGYGQQGQPYGPPQGYGDAPQGYGPPPYSTTAYGYGSSQPTTSSKATTVMVLGIVSLVLMFTCGLGFVTAIIALSMAGGAEREIAESGGTLTGESQVRAGRIMSWIALGITALFALLLVGIFALAVSTSP